MRLTLSLLGTIAFILLTGLTVSNLGGCQARYRYPCQDPVNWNKVECHNDACKAEGDCTSHVLGSEYAKREDDPSLVEASPDESLDDTAEKTNSETKTHISSKVQSTHTTEHSDSIPLDSEPSEMHTEGEQPLTMNTVVSTSEHNLAAR